MDADHIETEWASLNASINVSGMDFAKLREALHQIDPYWWRPREDAPRDPLWLGTLLGMRVIVHEPRPKIEMRQRFNSFGEPVFSESTIKWMNMELLQMFGEDERCRIVAPGVMYRLYDSMLVMHRKDFEKIALYCA